MTDTPPPAPIRIPFMEHCGIVFIAGERGATRVRATVEPHLRNTRVHAHGGLVMTMLDIALGWAAKEAAHDAQSFMTVDMQVQFLAPGMGEITAEGRVTRAGRSLVFCEGEARNAEGEMIARATGLFKPLYPR
jgi:uncharacterized protein (TIGR00369 family)